jgi:hypothetical protein
VSRQPLSLIASSSFAIMKFIEKAVCVALAMTVGVTAQDIFEAPDFNVTEALINNGVNVSAIPELAGLVVRSSLSDCSIAVGRHILWLISTSANFPRLCNFLKLVYGSRKLAFGEHAEYWSNQQLAVQPRCTFTPNVALEVTTLVLISRITQCPFAVKSGGHAAFPGASNIEGGITVDLVDFKQQKLAADKKTVAIGPGNRWLDVYTYLTPYNLTVVGGRVS